MVGVPIWAALRVQVSQNRFAAQRDANEPAIIAEFEGHGWMVLQNAKLDLEVQCPNCRSHLSIEVKSAKGRLTDSQRKLRRDGWFFYVLTCHEEVSQLIRAHGRSAH